MDIILLILSHELELLAMAFHKLESLVTMVLESEMCVDSFSCLVGHGSEVLRSLLQLLRILVEVGDALEAGAFTGHRVEAILESLHNHLLPSWVVVHHTEEWC